MPALACRHYSGNKYIFTGREWDKETGLYYHRARYYDPMEGRFISKDPIGIRGGINLYAYVGNSPINFTDKYGTTIDLKNAGQLASVLETIKRTAVGRWLAHVLEDSTEVYYIVLMPSGTGSNYNPKSRAIRIDAAPYKIKVEGGCEVEASLERKLAHEMGHAVYKGITEEANIDFNENPVAVELGQSRRIKY